MTTSDKSLVYLRYILRVAIETHKKQNDAVMLNQAQLTLREVEIEMAVRNRAERERIILPFQRSN